MDCLVTVGFKAQDCNWAEDSLLSLRAIFQSDVSQLVHELNPGADQRSAHWLGIERVQTALSEEQTARRQHVQPRLVWSGRGRTVALPRANLQRHLLTGVEQRL